MHIFRNDLYKPTKKPDYSSDLGTTVPMSQYTASAGFAYFATSKTGQPSRTAPYAKCHQIDASRCHTGALAVSVVLESKC